MATTNQQVHCPLFDAATLAVQQFYESTFSGKIRHLSSKECVVILTHKPCQHGRSSLLAGNFHRILYLFDDKSFPGSSESSSSSCIKANKSAGLESTEHPFKVTSISEIINGISDRKREKANTSNQLDPLGLTANVAEEIETDSEQKITLPSAKSMAISAATDSLIMTTRRRIDQLTKAYLHINDESLLHAKR